MDVKIYDDCDTRFSFSGRVLLAPDESRFQTNGYRTICLIAWGPYLNPDRRFKVSLLSETVIVFRGDNVRWKKNVYFLFFFFERTTSRHGNNGTIVTLTSRSFARCRRITTRRAHVRPTRNKARARAYLSDKKIEKKVKKVKKSTVKRAANNTRSRRKTIVRPRLIAVKNKTNCIRCAHDAIVCYRRN